MTRVKYFLSQKTEKLFFEKSVSGVAIYVHSSTLLPGHLNSKGKGQWSKISFKFDQFLHILPEYRVKKSKL